MTILEAIHEELVICSDNHNDPKISWTENEKDIMTRHIAYLKWLYDRIYDGGDIQKPFKYSVTKVIVGYDNKN